MKLKKQFYEEWKKQFRDKYFGIDGDSPDKADFLFPLIFELMDLVERNAKLDAWDEGYQAGFFKLPIEKAKADMIRNYKKEFTEDPPQGIEEKEL